jgi:hypothetical protein
MLLGVAGAIALILAGTALIPQVDHSSTTFPEASPGTKPPVQRQIQGLPRPAAPFQASNEALDRGEANSMQVLANDPGSTTAPEGRTGTKASPQSNITESAEKPANAAEARELAKESVTESGAEPSLASGSSENSATSTAPNSEPEMAANTKAELPPPPPSSSVVREAAKSKPARYLSGDFMEKNGPVGRLQGTVAVRFIVDRNGRARGCRATGGSGNAALGTITCQLVEDRLRFEPALDSQGRPIQSELRTTYNWVRKRKRWNAKSICGIGRRGCGDWAMRNISFLHMNYMFQMGSWLMNST